jgi:hypothetical protein
MTKKKRGKRALNPMKVAKVIDMVAQGQPNAVILADTGLQSRGTVAKIKKTHGEIVEAKKRKYSFLIDRFSGGDVAQAKILGRMIKAKRTLQNSKGEVVGIQPDHKARLDAIRYIDEIKGRHVTIPKLTQNNVYINKELERFIK